ncbi:hypothetical protein FISHEDRAFT_68827 [Fistulina hepatica ATCC 64428]|uniref:Uncharacterized protein n=1 Tax=Fistulina hepatica ATCC 64428 TaxID=1128425 RepID=A0A0D7AQ79_9AGAR|nr:hypothetical protein FISHEDRAFT_68827 [Fistulina hepatica ATCC 64428]
MPDVGDRVTLQNAALVESQELVLPSSLNAEERLGSSMDTLVKIEADLCEGAIHKEQGNILTAVALVSMGCHSQCKQVSGQDGNTCAQCVIQRNEAILNEAIASLRAYVDPEKKCCFKEVHLKDVYQKNTMEKQALGDSHRNEGSIYHGSGTPSATPACMPSTFTPDVKGAVGIMTTKKQKGLHNNSTKESTSEGLASPSAREGTLSSHDKMTDGVEVFINCEALHLYLDIEEWEKEANRVQYFRAEADFMNWRDEREKKIAELRRHICSCKTMAAHWTALVQQSSCPGATAYAQCVSTTWSAMEQRAHDRMVNNVPIPSYIRDGHLGSDGSCYLVNGARPLWEVFLQEHRLEAKIFQGLPITLKSGQASYLDGS